MSKISEFLKNLFSASYKRTAGLIVLLILIVAVPVTLNLVKQRQELRQRASCDSAQLTCKTPGVITLKTKETQTCNNENECNEFYRRKNEETLSDKSITNLNYARNSKLVTITYPDNSKNSFPCSSDDECNKLLGDCNKTQCQPNAPSSSVLCTTKCEVSGSFYPAAISWYSTTTQSCNSISGCTSFCSSVRSLGTLPGESCEVTTTPYDCPISCPAETRKFWVIDPTQKICSQTINEYADANACKNVSGDNRPCYETQNACQAAIGSSGGGTTGAECNDIQQAGSTCESNKTCYDVNGTPQCLSKDQVTNCIRCTSTTNQNDPNYGKLVTFQCVNNDTSKPLVDKNTGQALGASYTSCAPNQACTPGASACSPAAESTGTTTTAVTDPCAGKNANDPCDAGKTCQADSSGKLQCLTAPQTPTCNTDTSCKTADGKTGTCQNNQCVVTAQAPTCDSAANKVGLSSSPSTPKLNDQIAFSLSQDSSLQSAGDSWSGGVDCAGTLSASGSKTCKATTAGNFSWTHNWKVCLSTDQNQCNLCTANLSFAVASSQDTLLTLSVKMPGIDALSGDNNNPTTPRKAKIIAYYGNDKVAEVNSDLNYDSSKHLFTGTVNFQDKIKTAGLYNIKAQLDNTLFKKTSQLINLTPGQTNQFSENLALVSGDLNGDNKIDVTDWNAMLLCFHEDSSCQRGSDPYKKADLGNFGIIDLRDINIMLTAFATREGD